MGGILLAAALAGAFVWFLYAFQEALIYHPLPSRIAVRDELPAGVEALQYTIEGPRRERLRQESYLALPTGSADSKGIRLAVLFHGNASSALDWPEAAGYLRERGFHLLMVEYPGYGRCEGEPSPESIELASREAFRALAERLEVPERELERRTVAIGHSLGSAAALLFASDRDLQQVILLAPFTSSMDLARRRVGWPLCLLLRHRYDNRSLLAKIVDRQRPPEVLIVHGARDDIIPPGMSRRLAEISPAISRVELPEADHVTVVDASREAILDALSDAK
ncbi:MAG: alpha/beta hydrolase [Armatimonadota bacterium]